MYYLSDCCLLCLEAKNLKSVLLHDDNETSVEEELKCCLPEIITILKSKIPEFICSSCRTAVHSFYKFKKTCLENYSRLIQYTQILQGSSNLRDQKFSEMKIEINKIDLMIERVQGVDNALRIKEGKEYSLHLLEEHKQRTDNIKKENDLKFKELQIQLNNQEIMRERQQEVDSKLNIEIENQVSLQSLNVDEDKPVLDEVEVKEEFVASKDSEDHEIYVKYIKNELAFDNEQDSVSRSSCEGDSQPNLDDADFRADTDNVNSTGHMKIHTAIKCSICDKRFLSKKYLKQHMKIHEGIKDFKCSVCEKKFLLKHNLKVHMTIHTGIRDLKCSVCEKAYSLQSRLKEHMKIHAEIKEFKCSICEKKFTYNFDLKVHMKIHAGIKDFKCSVCKKKFLLKSNLKVHMKIHEGIKDFKCSVCKKKFLLKSNLKVHMKIHART